MTLEAFGKMFKPAVDKSTVLRWEQGRVPAGRALQISQMTGIPISKLLPHLFEVPAKRPRKKTKQVEAVR